MAVKTGREILECGYEGSNERVTLKLIANTPSKLMMCAFVHLVRPEYEC